MNRKLHLGAVILAAGLSTRMGATKALLPLNGRSALERAAGTFRAAGVDDIVVVTGHDRDNVAAEATRLGVREVPNRDYQKGMFTSVQTGIRSLPAEVDAFFVLPVDCPLVSAETIAMLADFARADEKMVICPTCLGKRGHPPLITGQLRAPLAAAAEDSSLRGFLRLHASSEHEVETNDLCILLDMDTARDHNLLGRLAFARDAAHTGPYGHEPRLTPEDAEHLLRVAGAEDRVVRHCRVVAKVAVALAEGLNARGADLDVGLTQTGALLHDMAKGQHRHAAKAEDILTHMGLRRVAEIVGAHMVLPEAESPHQPIRERELVYLADKLVVEDTPADLEARIRHALQTHSPDHLCLTSIQRRMGVAKSLSERIEQQLGRDIANLLADAGISPES